VLTVWNTCKKTSQNSGADYLIGASGVVSKMSVTVVGSSSNNWLTGANDLA